MKRFIRLGCLIAFLFCSSTTMTANVNMQAKLRTIQHQCENALQHLEQFGPQDRTILVARLRREACCMLAQALRLKLLKIGSRVSVQSLEHALLDEHGMERLDANADNLLKRLIEACSVMLEPGEELTTAQLERLEVLIKHSSL